MTKLNIVLTVLLVIGIVLPGAAVESGLIADFGFAGIMARIIPVMAIFLLLNNAVALMARGTLRQCR
jgi:uncharacterized membrane protein YadS